MIPPRWRKVLRDLWGNKGRTILVVLSIATGVFAIGLVATAQGLLVRNMNQSYEETSPANVTFLAEGMTQQLVDGLVSSGDATAAYGRRYLQARTQLQGEEWKNTTIYALPDYENITVKKLIPKEGDYPPADGELLLERSSLKIMNAKVGGNIQIQGPGGQISPIKVGGIVQDMNVYPSNFSDTVNAYISFDTLAAIGQPSAYNQLDVIVAGSDLTDDEVHQAAINLRDNVLASQGVEVLAMIVYPVGKHPLSSLINTLSIFLGGIGLLTLLLGAFLVINTINSIIGNQVRQIGVMKSIGATTGQITRMYLALVLAFGLLALIVAAPLAMLGGRGVINFMADLINFNITSYRVPAWVFGLEVLVGLLVPLLAALWPVYKGSRISVREAISSYGIEEGKGKGSLLEKVLNRFKHLSRPLMLSLRNTFRRRGRLALTMTTLILAGSIFISIFCVRSSMLRTLDQALAFWNFDVQVSFETAQPSDQLVSTAESVSGVTQAETLSGALAFYERPDGTENAGMVIYGIDASSGMVRPTLEQGRWLQDGDTNVVVVNSDFINEEEQVKLSDSIQLNVQGQVQSWQVVGIIESRLTGEAVYAENTYLSGYLGQQGQSNYVFVQTQDHSEAARTQAANDLEDAYRGAGMPPSTIETVSEIQAGAENQFNILILFMLIMAVLLATVGGLGLMGTMGLNVMERTREIGVMRSIGATNRTVKEIFVVEGLIIGAISWVVAALLSLPISLLLSYIVGHSFFKAGLSYSYAWSGLVIWLALALGLSAVASWLPARRASRLTVRDVLAYE